MADIAVYVRIGKADDAEEEEEVKEREGEEEERKENTAGFPFLFRTV